MSATIDERIVRMEFDNKDFEKNVHTSLSTLDKLKNALGFTKQKEELQTLATAINTTKFDGIVSSIQAIEDRFSVFGIVGKRIIENLTDDFMNFTKNVILAIPNQIATGGWNRALNVEEAKFTLKGLGVAWEEVADDIDHAVLGTAYGADEASKAAAQLAASGVQWGGVIGMAEDGTEVFSEMGRALRGISGVAAMTNSSYSEIANIFTTVAGQGKLMTQQLRMMESRGLNAAAAMAKVFGTTEEEVRELVHDGEIDFQLFADAMDLAFGEHATAANETFQGSMDNMKAALSRIGQDWAQTILQQTPQVFNSLKGFFNKIRTYTKPLADNIFTPVFSKAMHDISGFIDNVTAKMPKSIALFDEFAGTNRFRTVSAFSIALQGIYNIGRAILSVIKPIAQAFSELFSVPSIDSLVEITTKFKKFTEQLILTREQSERVYEVTKFVLGILVDVKNAVGDVIYILSPLTSVFVAIIDGALRIASALYDLLKSLRGSDKDTDIFASGVETAHDAVKKFADILVVGINKVTDFVEMLINTKLATFIGWVKDAYHAVKDFNDETGIITNTFKTLGKVLLAPIYLIYQLVSAVYEFGKSVLAMPEVQAILTAIVDKITELGTIGYEHFRKFIDYIKTVDPKKVFNDIKDVVVDLKDKLADFFNRLSESSSIVRGLKDEFVKLLDNFRLLRGGVSAHTIYEEIEEPMESTKSVVEKFREAISKAFDVVKEFFSNLDTDKLIAIAFTGAMLGMVLSVWKLVSNFSKLTEGVTGLIGSFTGVGNAIQGFIKSWSKKDHSKILDFAGAVAILTGCLIALALVKEEHDLWGAAAVLAAVAAGLTVFTIALALFSKSVKKANSWKELAVLDATMLAISGSVLILAGAFKLLGDVNLLSAQKTLLVIAELAAIMLGVSFVLSKFSGKGLRGFLTLIAFSLVLKNFGKAMKSLADIDYTNIKDNLKTLAIVFAGLAAVAAVASNIGLFSAVGLVALVLTMNKIIPMLEKMSKADVSNLTKAIRSNLDLIKTLGLIALAMIAVSAFLGKGIKQFGIGMILISVALIAMGKAIDIIGSLSAEKAKQGTKVIEELLGMFALIALISSIPGGRSGMIKVAAAIGIFTLCLYPLAGVMWILGTMDEKKVKQGTSAIAALMLCFGVVTLLSSFGDGAQTKSVIGLVIGIVALCGELIALTYVPAEQIASAALALDSVMLALGILLYSAGQLGEQEHPILAIAQMVVLGGLLFEISKILVELSKQPWQNVLAAAAAMAIVMASMGIVFDLMSVSVASVGDVGLFLLLTLSLIPIGVALYVLSQQKWQNMLAAATAISMVLLAFTGITLILQMINPAAAIAGALGFMAVVGIITVLSMALAALVELLPQSWMDWIMAGFERLKMVAGALGEVVGAFIGGIVGGGALYAMIGIAEGLKYFAETADPFVQWIKKVDEDTVSGTKNLALALLAFSAGSLLSSFLALNPLSMASISLSMKLLGEGVKAFADAVSGIDSSSIDEAAEVANTIFGIDTPRSGGLVQAIIGEKNYENFNKEIMTSFGEGIKGFADSVAGVTKEDAQGGLDLASALFAIDPPNQGGLVAMIIGDNNFKKFNSKVMTSFGEGLKEFAGAVAGLTLESAEGGIAIAEALFSLKAPNQGGLVSWIIGDNNFKKFNAKQLGEKGFGGGLKAFAESVSGIESSAASVALDIADKLFSLNAPNQGGLVSWIIGDNNFKKFNAKQLGEKGLGGGIKAFADSVAELSEDAITKASAAASVLTILDGITIKKQGGIMGILSFFAGGSNANALTDLATKFGGLGSALNSFYVNVQGINPEVITAAVTAMDSIYDLLSNMQSFDNEKISGFASAMEAAGNLGVEAFCNALINSKDQVSTATATFMQTAASSVEANQSIFASSADTMYNGFVTELTGSNAFNMGGDISGYSQVMDQLGYSLDSSWATSLMNNSDMLTGGIDGLSEEMLEQYMQNFGMSSLNGDSSVAGTLATAFDQSYANNLINTSNINAIRSSVTTVGTNVQNAWQTGPASIANATQDAKNTMQGYVNGIGDEQIKRSAVEKIKAFGLDVRDGWRNLWNEHSPSRVAAEDAANVVYGYVIGIEKNIGVATAAMDNFSTSIYDSLRDATSGVTDYVAENMDLTPTISPYIDTAGVDRDVQNLNSLFENGKQLTINSKLGVMADAMGGYADAQTAGSNNIVDAINLLNENVRTLYGVVGNLQVVMDSGSLVGAIAPGMDVALGQRANLKRRGV